jgi:hypothetical protein
MTDPQESINRWREANRRLRAVVLAAGVALAILIVPAVIQFTVTMLAVRTLDDAKQESDRARREALEALQQLQRLRDEAPGESKEMQKEEMKKEDKDDKEN